MDETALLPEDPADGEGPRRVIVDADTASDDALALLYLARSPAVTVEGVTIVAGNVPFEREVENAKHALSVVDRADVPVYEGAREPLVKSFEHATDVHGEGGLGGDLRPETGVPSADEHAVDFIRRTLRDAAGDAAGDDASETDDGPETDDATGDGGAASASRDGSEVTLVCLGPLTNVALALATEPELARGLRAVYWTGGAVHAPGNVTPAAEYNAWVDPDAAGRVLREVPATVLDWGLATRQGLYDPDDVDRLSAHDAPEASFFGEVARPMLADAVARPPEGRLAMPDLLTAAVAADPGLVTSARETRLAVDDREGLTRGQTVTDPGGELPSSGRVALVEAVDEERLEARVAALLRGEVPAGE